MTIFFFTSLHIVLKYSVLLNKKKWTGLKIHGGNPSQHHSFRKGNKLISFEVHDERLY